MGLFLNNIRFVVAAIVACSAVIPVIAAEPFETKARQAFMVDALTSTILFAKDPDTPLPPASMAKLMTMEVVFEALKAGRLSLDQTFKVSENAWRTGGAPAGVATMFAEVNSSVSVADLIRGVVVQAANDACIVIAEGMAGSEQDFARLMNERASALGLRASTFTNSTGLPADGQQVTPRELVALAEHLWREHADLYTLYAQPDFTWNKITQRNRNPLIPLGIGADGLVAGFAEGSGYSIVGGVDRAGKRLFAVLAGAKTDRERLEEARRMLEWGTNGFARHELFGEGQPVGRIDVYGGAQAGVALAAKGPVAILLPAAEEHLLSARIVYQGPLAAPVEQGAEIGRLRVLVDDRIGLEVPLFAAEAVAVGSLHQRALDALAEVFTGWLR